MRTIAHLSDLHFGRIDEAVLEPLARAVAEARPHLVVVSGDLTQRARSGEFRAARAFLDRLPSPQVVVPGNHDVPMHNLLTRFVEPLGNYGRYIARDLEPAYFDDEMAVVGVNTARSLTVKSGRVNAAQVARLCERFASLPGGVVKVVVSHHPFDVPDRAPPAALVGRARMARTRLLACGTDLFLSGHFHVGRAGHTAVREDESGRAVVVVQAGTATSTRGRGEPNSFNLVRIDDPDVVAERLDWRGDRDAFEPAAVERFQWTAGGFRRVG